MKSSPIIQWVNHASYILPDNNNSLICGPWIEGKAFHNGWLLLANPDYKPADFQKVTHIWFSHEHPDHFSPPTLAKIVLLLKFLDASASCAKGILSLVLIPCMSMDVLTFRKTGIFTPFYVTRDLPV
jgi:hypothetical protein